jgi:hypothetical protein
MEIMAGENQGVRQFWLFRNPYAEEERGEHHPVIMMMRAGFLALPLPWGPR